MRNPLFDMTGFLHELIRRLRQGNFSNVITRGFLTVFRVASISFGPPWFHPHGGHLFSVFPWAHLIFTENALIRWRSDFKTDGAKRFGEVEGGLNQMTVKRFKKIISASPFRFDRLDIVPIRRLRYPSNVITKEFFTSIVRCRLVLR